MMTVTTRSYVLWLHRLVLLGCTVVALQAAPPEPPAGYHWVADPRFSDEFNGTKLDAEKWHDHHPKWQGRPPAKFVPSALSVQDGVLRIRNGVLNPPQGRFTISGGAVVSKSTQAHFGYYEVRMKASRIPMSSTFWFSNDAERKGDLRISQELDVIETIGGAKKNTIWRSTMHSNTHIWVHRNGERLVRSKPGVSKVTPDTGEAFHTYGVWWVDANTVHFYHDNEFQFTLHPDTTDLPKPFARPMHLNLVTETYDWEPPPTPEELNNDTINATEYDWVHGYRLEIDKKESAQSTDKTCQPAAPPPGRTIKDRD